MSGGDIQERTREIANALAANGARFDFQPAEGSQAATFSYALPRGGDRWRCRGLVAAAKADPELWAALVAEIDRRCSGIE